MPDMLAIVARKVFESGGSLRIDSWVQWDDYDSRSPRLSLLGTRSRLFLVTVRPPDERLWLVAIYEHPKKVRGVWRAATPNTTRITDITHLRPLLKFDNGIGLAAPAGLLANSLQSPRVLTEDDVKLLDDAVSAADAERPELEEGEESDDDAAPFLGRTEDQQGDVVCEILLGRGPLPIGEAVAIATHAIRAEQPDASAPGDEVRAAVHAVIDRGVRREKFDRPSRGKVRALARHLDVVGERLWQMCLLATVSEAPIDRDVIVTLAAYWARDMLGLDMQRLRADGKIAAAIREAIDATLAEGLLERVGRSRLRRTATGQAQLEKEFADGSAVAETSDAEPESLPAEAEAAGNRDREHPQQRVVLEPRELPSEHEVLIVQLPETFGRHDSAVAVERHLSLLLIHFLRHRPAMRSTDESWAAFIAHNCSHVDGLSTWLAVPRNTPTALTNSLRETLQNQGASFGMECGVLHGHGFRPLLVWGSAGLELPPSAECALDDDDLADLDVSIVRRPLVLLDLPPRAAATAEVAKLLVGDPAEISAPTVLPDLGTKLLGDGGTHRVFRITRMSLGMLGQVNANLATASGQLQTDRKYLVSLDFDAARMRQLMALTPDDAQFSQKVLADGRRVLTPEQPIIVGCVARLGDVQTSERERFVPLLVEEFVPPEATGIVERLEDGGPK